LPATTVGQPVQYSAEVKSVFDIILGRAGTQNEKTYSAPFATHLFSKETKQLPNGKEARIYPTLEYVAGGSITKEVWQSALIALVELFVINCVIAAVIGIFFVVKRSLKQPKSENDEENPKGKAISFQRQIRISIITFWITLSFILFLSFFCLQLEQHYHIFGTDKVGVDVFYIACKSIRTALILGTLTTLFTLPFALFLGTMAGYFGGIIDDIIQYLYITLSSVPGVLLIAASVLALEIFISNHPNLFDNIAARADARLLALCMILGLTSWTSLCRLLRGESLKLRELDYVQAARALGVSHIRIIMRHIMPNAMHIVLIALVLDFSGLVLAEAVLTYVGVGVDPTTYSWGNMINSGRLELARDPVVWWPLLAAFVLMFTLVLTANLVADVVREAFDPRVREG
jgi:peptide/nickel transport system permease protein